MEICHSFCGQWLIFCCNTQESALNQIMDAVKTHSAAQNGNLSKGRSPFLLIPSEPPYFLICIIYL